MRALILMPLNETSEHVAISLMCKLDDSGYDALSMPNYIDFLVMTKIVKSYEQGVVRTLRDALLFVGDHEKNCIIIGNCSKTIPFDVILAVNPQNEEGEKIEDHQLQAMREKYADAPEVLRIINDCYSVEDAEYATGNKVDAIYQLITELCPLQH